jgi:hypothetical protein
MMKSSELLVGNCYVVEHNETRAGVTNQIVDTIRLTHLERREPLCKELWTSRGPKRQNAWTVYHCTVLSTGNKLVLRLRQFKHAAK